MTTPHQPTDKTETPTEGTMSDIEKIAEKWTDSAWNCPDKEDGFHVVTKNAMVQAITEACAARDAELKELADACRIRLRHQGWKESDTCSDFLAIKRYILNCEFELSQTVKRMESYADTKSADKDAELAELRKENKELKKLVEVAACPNCDGSGAVATGEHFVTHEMALDAGDLSMEGQSCGVEWQRCQWCDERKKLLGTDAAMQNEKGKV